MHSSTPASSSVSPKRPKRDSSPRATSDYIAIKRTLGQGQNATVYLVEYNSDSTPRAMKKIPRNNKRTENMNRLRANNPARAPLPRTTDPTSLVDRRGTEEAKIRKEIAIMKKCDHPNIIKFYSFIDDKTSANICLIMEYMAGGELQWSSDSEPYLTMDQTRRCMRDVVLGLQYLHLQGIIHRDIKPSNIMWTADRSHVKIGDFGVAHLAVADDELGDVEGPRHAGTPAFLAPEIAPGGDAPMGEVTTAVDLWALGVTFYCMLFGRMPFQPHLGAIGHVAAEATLYRAIREDPWHPRDTMSSQPIPVKPEDWDNGGVLHLLHNLLLKDPAVRFGITHVKDSAWLLHDVQRRQEWITGTTPKIVVSAADEANAILEPRFKWNFRAVGERISLGRRIGNLFRTVREPGTGVVRSEPTPRARPHRVKDKEAKVPKDKGKGKAPAQKKSRSVDAQRSLALEGSASKPRRGSETVRAPPPPPLSAAPSTATASPADSPPPRRGRGFFHWPGRDSPTSARRGTAARHSTEALRSAPMGLGLGLLATEQRTSSLTNARAAASMGMGMSMGMGGVVDGYGEGEAAGMIAAPRAVAGEPAAADEEREVFEEESAYAGGEEFKQGPAYDEDADSMGSGCSYGSEAHARGDYGADDGDALYDDVEDEYPDDDGEGARVDVYDNSSEDEDVPITFKSARARVAVPALPLNGSGGGKCDAGADAAEVPPDSEDDDDGGKRPYSPVVIPLPNGPGL
ncbi:kinase-like domain-containing protein [Mycena vulgaris]|nr:kinase-like domain-containing protein [Mycena vulgaris]